MNQHWDILGLGCVAVDDLVYLDRYPGPGEKVFVRGRQRQGGGLAATAMAAAARLGARVAYLGRLGEDELSRFSLEELQREGVDCSPTLRDPQAGPHHSIILVDGATGERTILIDPSRVVEPPAEAITPEVVRACKLLFVDDFALEAGLRAAALARSLGIPVVADLEGDDPRLPELLALIDHLIVSLEWAGRYTGESSPPEILRRMAGERACTVVTAGQAGCWYLVKGSSEAQRFPAFSMQAVDTTGCGDVFHGAYAAALARGEPIDLAIREATAAAGLKTLQPGGRAGIPTLTALRTFLFDQVWGRLSERRLTVDGVDTPLEVDRQQVEQFYLPLARELLARLGPGARRVVGIAGPPGSGKTSFAALLSATINAVTAGETAVVVGLDGWHFANRYLETHTTYRDGQEIPLRQVKGAPESFDVAAALGWLQEARRGGETRFPVYSRTRHEPQPGGGSILSHHHIMMMEGNYLLLGEAPWPAFRGLFDLTIFLHADPERLAPGLEHRHARGGKTPEAARRHVAEVDLPNARRVLAGSTRADVTVFKADGGSIERIEWS